MAVCMDSCFLLNERHSLPAEDLLIINPCRGINIITYMKDWMGLDLKEEKQSNIIAMVFHYGCLVYFSMDINNFYSFVCCIQHLICSWKQLKLSRASDIQNSFIVLWKTVWCKAKFTPLFIHRVNSLAIQLTVRRDANT